MGATSDALDSGLLQFTNGSVVGKGGFIDTPNQRLTVRHILPILKPADLAEVVVATRGDQTIKVGDVAKVVKDHQALIGDAVIDGGPGLMMIVEKLPWGNTLEVTKGVEAAIDEMRPGLPGMNIDTTIFRPATFVEEALNNLGRSLVLGAVLVVVILALFLFDWRSALISVITIPMSLIAAGLVLYARGATINTMVLAGFVIALGAIVDDAIVDVENIVRRLRLAAAEGSQQSKASIILESSIEVRGAVVYASFIEALALLPIFFLEGLTGAFFKPLAFSYALAVLVSLVVALILTPALSMILFSRAKVKRTDAPIVRWLQAGYDQVPHPHRAQPGSGLRGGGRHRRDRVHRRSQARPGAAPGLQGAGLPDALGDEAGYVAGRRGPHHHQVGRGAPGHPGGAELRGPHRPGPRLGRAGGPGVR